MNIPLFFVDAIMPMQPVQFIKQVLTPTVKATPLCPLGVMSRLKTSRRLAASISLTLGLAIALPALAVPQVVGHVDFAKGSNAAQLPGDAPRILGKDADIFQGDNIQTTESSFVVVAFTDGAKVTVRPNSNFSIDRYDSQPTSKAAQMVLHQGGVNTSTGAIAQANPANYQIKTPTATVKPNSEKAEYSVAICDKGCEEKGRQAVGKTVRTEQSVVARVVDIKGEVRAINASHKDATERALSLGKPLYNADTVQSKKDSYALLIFPDGEKITVQADSEMAIKQYDYQIKDKKDQILYNLATGGLRALTGKIGKANPAAFAMDTPIATIGIRGTGTDTMVKKAPAYGDCDPNKVGCFNLEHSTWQGTSFIRNLAGEFDVPEGSSSMLSGRNAIPHIFPTPADAPQPPEPRPDSDKSDPDKVFEEKPPVQGDTAVKVLRGSTNIETEDGQIVITIDQGESASTRSDGKTTTFNQSYDTTSGTPPTGGGEPPDDGSLFQTSGDKIPANIPLDNESLFDRDAGKADNTFEGCFI
ncbi:MAG: FecR domain-containing protein [Methylobacter sp.]|nr:FecR domain-containing protein [Methylobacter sp.]MDP2100287.1 FecR domain-containing protein [Methylobacter sp.]MDP3055582.1 FecR domain-containing protein [Methylobacter sp.]MDZ4219806.1 FecR domain-containing protein [Methylobacter sp.]